MRFPTALMLFALLAPPALSQDAPAEPAPIEPAAPAAPAQPAEQQPEQPPAEAQQPATPDEQPEPEAPEPTDLSDLTVAELSAKLADRSFAVREAALRLLLQNNDLDEAAIADLLAAADSPEQRQRLLTVAEHHVVRSVVESLEVPEFRDRAAVGFRYAAVEPDDNPYAKQAGILVTATMPGFPGFAYLRPGDIILEINQQACPLDDPAYILRWVSATVTQTPGGGEMSLTIGRDGETQTLTFNASNAHALDEVYSRGIGASNRNAAYDRDWQEARERLAEHLPEPTKLVPEGE